MRNAADDVDAEVERALEIARRVRRAEIAVLREGDELQVEIGLDLALDVEQRLDREQAVVADVDVAAHREQALRDREIAIAQRALGDRLMRQQRLQFAPQRDAFEQRAGLVEPRQAERQRRVHMEMAIDERRRRRAGRARRSSRGLRRQAGSIATMRPSRTPMSTGLRPSGSVALRTRRSKVMAWRPESFVEMPQRKASLARTSANSRTLLSPLNQHRASQRVDAADMRSEDLACEAARSPAGRRWNRTGESCS